jgi:hypothetical protein
MKISIISKLLVLASRICHTVYCRYYATDRQVNGQAWPPHKAFQLYFIKNAWKSEQYMLFNYTITKATIRTYLGYVFRIHINLHYDYVAFISRPIVKINRTSVLFNMPWRPIGLWDVEALTFCRKSTHRWRSGSQPYVPASLYRRKILGVHFC